MLDEIVDKSPSKKKWILLRNQLRISTVDPLSRPDLRAVETHDIADLGVHKHGGNDGVGIAQRLAADKS